MFLSVVIPAYNVASSIRRTLDSLCKWHGDDIEIIVIDDGSLDDTAVVVRRSYANDSRVRLLSQDYCERSVARNLGLSVPSGGWVMLADADDYYLPDWNQAIRDCLLGKGFDSKLLVFAVKTSNGLDTFCCPVDEPFSGPDFQVPASKIRKSMIDNSLSGMKDNAGDFEWNSCWARLYKRSVLNNLIKVSNGSAFVPNLRFSEDGLFNLAYLNMLGSSSVQFIDKSVYYWGLGMSSTVATTNVEDADNVTVYSDALNTCGWLP